MDYDLSDDPDRIDVDAVWEFLSTEAYWGRSRSRNDVERQVEGAWRVVAAFEAGTNTLVGFARAVSDGMGFAYLADVFVLPAHRGNELGKRIVSAMIDEGPGANFRWTLFTGDAHDLYRQFGFTEPDTTAMVRPARTPQ
ncbi:GNAT family N-acetyltransferase [Salinibacterium sp. ZJ454]|uniref:GNAT family N-acetyltransferase n=1 Tax=Salinibacterium sp. ZJ454 TaxID=2708339 RepID=UPI00141F9024|nr:GNAT family N-acetyltransferase [Salinibacterium sp. ZJ454]